MTHTQTTVFRYTYIVFICVGEYYNMRYAHG